MKNCRIHFFNYRKTKKSALIYAVQCSKFRKFSRKEKQEKCSFFQDSNFPAGLFPRVELIFCVLSVGTRVWIDICFHFDFHYIFDLPLRLLKTENIVNLKWYIRMEKLFCPKRFY